jgi:hypothetical protein
MDLITAIHLAGQGSVVVQVKGSEDPTAFGILERVTEDGWVGVRGPFNRYDEYRPQQLEIDPT